MDLPLIRLPEVVSTAELEGCGRLAYRTAHDLGNIRTATLGNLDPVGQSLDVASPLRRRVQNIAAAMGHAEAFSLHLERFLGQNTRDTAGTLSVTEIPCETTADAMAFLETKAGMQVVLDALVANAREATVNTREARISVEVGMTRLTEAEATCCLGCAPMRPEGEYAYVAVEDNGEGIAEDNLSRLFAPAFSTRMRQPGFGLSDVYGIVCRRHKGGILLRTAPGRGTRVVAILTVKEYALVSHGGEYL